jgi:hypothetical protein
MAARTSPPRTVATRRTRPITGVGGFGKEKCGDGRARRNIPPRTGNEPVAGDASETAMLVGTHLSQQTPPEECMTGVREGDAKLCRRGSSFDGRHFPIAKADASRDETFFQLFAKRKADRVSRFFGLLALSDGKSKQCFFSSIFMSRIEQHIGATREEKKKASDFLARRFVTNKTGSFGSLRAPAPLCRPRTGGPHHSSSVMKSESFRSSSFVPGVCSTPMASMSALPFARSALS